MKITTFFKEEEGQVPEKPLIEHKGFAGITVTLIGTPDNPEIRIEYAMERSEYMVTMVRDLLTMCFERMPGVAENAVGQFLKDNNFPIVDNMAHIKYEDKRN